MCGNRSKNGATVIRINNMVIHLMFKPFTVILYPLLCQMPRLNQVVLAQPRDPYRLNGPSRCAKYTQPSQLNGDGGVRIGSPETSATFAYSPL